MADIARDQLGRDYAKALDIINGLREQRDKLLAALKACVDMYGPSDLYGHDARVVWQQAEAAIKDAEGHP